MNTQWEVCIWFLINYHSEMQWHSSNANRQICCPRPLMISILTVLSISGDTNSTSMKPFFISETMKIHIACQNIQTLWTTNNEGKSQYTKTEIRKQQYINVHMGHSKWLKDYSHVLRFYFEIALKDKRWWFI